jgi:hypothetical protein
MKIQKQAYVLLTNNPEQKLNDYKANPDANDNKGLLKDANPANRKNIIKGRENGLQKEINKFKNEQNKIQII